jgi:sugar phosphate isomerase/epimerase
VGLDRYSQDIDTIAELSRRYAVPVLAVHAPCLLISQHVWGADPWRKLARTREAAIRLGASVVVVHPPFAWQRQYARTFADGVARLSAQHAADGRQVRFAVENMFPIAIAGQSVSTYRPGWRVEDGETSLYQSVAFDVSHTASSASDTLAVQAAIGPALHHLHLGDGIVDPAGRPGKDEHLVPGRGTQPCAEVLRRLPADYAGSVVLEINTRYATTQRARRADLAESLAFTRKYLRRPA